MGVKMENIKENKIGTAPIPKLLFSISVPIIISMLVQALYNIVDSVFVARFDPNAGTGALTLAFPIQNLIIAVSVGLAVGMNALLSRSLGEKNREKATLIAGQGFFLAFCGYLLFLVFGLFLVKPFVGGQVTEGTLHYEYAYEYISIVSVGSIGIFIQVVSERLLQSTGKSMLSMTTQLSGAIVNIILDPILIFGMFGLPEMGVRGAAIATVIGQFVSAAVGVALNVCFNKEIKILIKNFLPKAKLIRDMLVIGIPSIIMQAIGSVMTYSLNNILLGFSEEALNAFGVYFKLQSFVFMPIFGLNSGMVPIIAYNYGAKATNRVKKTMRLAMISAVAYMAFGMLIFQLIPGALLSIFNAGEELLAVGKSALRIISTCFPFAGVSIICSSTCQALGKSIYSLYLSAARQLIILIPSAYLLALLGQVNLVWLSFPIAEIVALVLAIIFARYVLKKTMGHYKDAPHEANAPKEV